MKKLILLIIALAFSGSALFNTLAVADYFLRYDYYDLVLCEKRTDPENDCHGSCKLKAGLIKEPANEKNLPKLKVFEFYAEFPENKETNTTSHFGFKLNKTFSADVRLTNARYLNDIFHPPRIT